MILRVRPRVDDKPSSFQSRFNWTVERPAERAAPPPPVPVRIAEPVPDSAHSAATEQPAGATDSRVRALIDEAIKADSANDQVVDTLLVTPAIVTIKVGDRAPIGRAIAIIARNPDGRAIPGIRIRVRIETGEEFARVENGALLGLTAGSAVLVVEPPRPPGTTGGEPKGASRVLVRVVP